MHKLQNNFTADNKHNVEAPQDFLSLTKTHEYHVIGLVEIGSLKTNSLSNPKTLKFNYKQLDIEGEKRVQKEVQRAFGGNQTKAKRNKIIDVMFSKAIDQLISSSNDVLLEATLHCKKNRIEKIDLKVTDKNTIAVTKRLFLVADCATMDLHKVKNMTQNGFESLIRLALTEASRLF